MRVLTECIDAAHAPLTLPSEARCVIRPAPPTTWQTRSSSAAMRAFSSMTSLSVSAILPSIPVSPSDNRVEKFPLLKAVSTVSSCFLSRASAASPLEAASIANVGAIACLADVRVWVDSPFLIESPYCPSAADRASGDRIGRSGRSE